MDNAIISELGIQPGKDHWNNYLRQCDPGQHKNEYNGVKYFVY